MAALRSQGSRRTGGGGEWGIGFSLLTEIWSPKWRATGGGVLQSVFIAGSLVGAITAGFVLPTYGILVGWRYAFYIAGTAAIVGGLIRVFMPESKYWIQYNDLRRGGELQREYVRTPLVQIFSKEVRRWTLFSLLIGSANLFIYFSYATYMPTLLGATFKIPIPDYTTILIVGQAVAIPFYWIDGLLADRYGRKITAVGYGVGYFLAALVFLGTLLEAPKFIAPYLFPVFYSYTFVSMMQGVSGEYGVWYGEHFPTRMRSTATNFGYMVGRGVAGATAVLFVPAVAGALGGIPAYGLAMSVAMLIGTVLQLIGILGLRETKGTVVTSV
ncbi:hypothetical protein HS1genome_0511 [Sulfodiicoccus acidiphilus]|uniref:Major facilitator superfamily (MFS) profile domain-containing protein n=1 Tax=Sulfodiicoccus acidiphilus TaxID=1670455 RepID=A0A348B1S0_9CREN|nr:MFS transporter [Sulfodiicoccus acidiphilus]BBD72122.1 hypothetical protein HS1genome_0511 [Sulfodiicoccus acidiphilus]